MSGERVPTVPTLGADFDDGDVRLRALSESDLPQLIDNCRDPAAVKWISLIPRDYTEADGRWYLDHVAELWAENKVHEFAVDATGRGFCGTINLHDFRNQTADVGINIGPHTRGTGVAGTAVRILIDYAFNGLNLNRLYWHCFVGNWASRKLAWKNGFTFAAELPGFGPGREHAEDTWLLTLPDTAPRRPSEAWVGPQTKS